MTPTPTDTGAAPRLFFALWPPPAVRDALAARAAALPLAGGRWVPAENLHLTLRFLGPTPAAARDALEAALVEAPSAFEPFVLRLDRAGYFAAARVVWLGAGRTPAALAALARGLERLARRAGFAAERRPFVAHVTVARKARPLAGPPSVEPLDWPVDAFELVESRLTPAGPQYRTVQRWTLTR